MNNVNQNNPNNQNQNFVRPVTGADVPLLLKARYFGSGVVVGVFVSEPVKALLAKFTSRFEGLAEKSSEILAQAKDSFTKSKDECCDENEVCDKEEPEVRA